MIKRVNRRRFLEISSFAAAGLLLTRLFDSPAASSAGFVTAIWSGALTPNSARVNAKIDHDSSTVRLLVSVNSDLSQSMAFGPHMAALALNNRMVSIPATGLASDTAYYYGIEADGVVDLAIVGQCRTPAVGAQSFSFVFASCADTGSSHPVFATMRSLQPLFFLHTGDLHYEDIAVNDRALFRSAFESVLTANAQATLYREVPVAYVWDDHDYGPNNSDSTAPGREAARLTYQEYVPHYPLAAGSGNVPIYQAFSIGRVRFILTDLRSERSPNDAPDDASKTMMGAAQKAWFKSQLLAANGRYAAIIWVSTPPWIGAAAAGQDHWAGFATERQELADFIRDNRVQGLVMLCGDAHMVALDDGSNSDYAVGGGAAFPVMHAAALDRLGSTKGGPYSHGTFPGRGQFGLVTVTDDGGDTVSINLSGRDVDNNVLVTTTIDLPSPVFGRRKLLPILMRS